ncbi:hypothetical protein [Vreelandella profundi]|uniref:hypothetical protein n=1 Tax=Vreelandella profundi TaxID=2852117 RepID=UPI001F2FC500|nr:hypothetical protein [Halomonas profundi]
MSSIDKIPSLNNSLSEDKHFIDSKLNRLVGFVKSRIYQDRVIAADFLIYGWKIAYDFVPSETNSSVFSLYCFGRNHTVEVKEILGYEAAGNKIYLGDFNNADGLMIQRVSDTLIVLTTKIQKKIKANDAKVKPGFEAELYSYAENKKHFFKKTDSLISKIRTDELFNIKDVVQENICIGCGACAVATNGLVGMSVTKHGIYKASLEDISNLSENLFSKADAVCPFSDSALDESELDVPNIASRMLPYDSSLGRYPPVSG